MMLVTKGKRILAMLLALIMSMGTMAVGTAAADKGTVENFHKAENLSDTTYTIEADTNFVIVKQATTAVVFLRDNLSENGQSELKELAAEEDASLNKGVDTWLFCTADEDGKASYQGTEANLGDYSVDFNAGTVTISALDKISHLDYGVYTPGEGSDSQEPGQPQEPTPVEPPEAVEWELSKSKEAAGLDENFESKVTLSLPAADYQDDLDVVFVLDGSTSSDKVDLTKTAAGLLNTLAGYHNLTVKVGVVIFGGYEPVLSTTELTVLDSTTIETLRDDVLTTDYNDMKDETDSYKLRSGSNLQAGVEAAREILNGDPNVAAENKYMIILSDGAARVWINEDGESVAQLHVANNWNTTEDFISRYKGTNKLELRTFDQIMEEASAGHAVGAYAITYEESKGLSTSLPEGVNYATDPYYYTNVEAGTYYAACSMMEASSECHIIWTAYHWTTVGSEEETFVTSFRNWMAENQYVTLYDVSDMQTEEEYQAVYADVHNDLIQLVDAGSKVVDVIGSDVDQNGVAYDFDFVNDMEKLTLTVDGVALEKYAISETSYGFGGDGSGSYDFVVTYYKDGATINGKTYTECFVWDINVPVTKDAPVQLTYSVVLTNPQTTAGTYDGLYTNNSATLFPVDSEGTPGASEDFEKPTVDYTVTETETPGTPGTDPTPTTVSLTVTKVWEDNDDEAEARPESITVTLLRNGEAYSTYTLSDSNDWQHTFTGLSGSYTWSVAEADVPEGYLSAVTGSGSAWTITNTYEAAELDDEDTPLSPAPGEETDMPDGDVPMGDGTGLEDGTEIVDPDTPLGDLPQTGAAQAVNPLATAGFMALAASMAAAGLVLTRTKSGKREEDC